MIFKPLPLQGAYLITLDKISDERGHFVRNWCKNSFQAEGLTSDFTQFNTSFNAHRHTLRGMHYQQAPFAEIKMVQCVQGRVFDVIVDLRPESETYLQHLALTLDSAQPQLLYIPQGFAHGFLTLTDQTQLTYYMGAAPYQPEAARGLLWSDPALGIPWPAHPQIISARDQQWERLSP